MTDPADIAKALTPAQRRVVENLKHGRPAYYGIHGKSAWGGLDSTCRALERKGLWKYGKGFGLTDLGRAVAAELQR